MNLFKIAWRSVRQRALSSTLTGFSMALGVALVVMVLVMLYTVEETFQKNANSWDMIVGAKGSKLQLVLNTVYHLSTPVENIPYWKYKELRETYTSMNAQLVMGNVSVIPVCMGDSYEGHRVVATIPELFELPYSQGLPYEFASGHNFEDRAGVFEAVVGSVAAHKIGLKVGDKIQPTHGIASDDGHQHDAFTVVGVLSPTGTPNDRAIFVNMEGFYLQDNHALSDEQVQRREQARAAISGDGKADEEHDHDHEGDDHGDDDHEDGDHGDEDHAADGHTDHDDADHDDADHDDADQDHADHDHEDESAAAGAQTAAAQQEDDHDHDDHDHAGHSHGHSHEPLPEEQREVTAVLIRFDPDRVIEASAASMSLQNKENEGPTAQAVLPLREVTNLFDTFIQPLRVLLMVLAVLIVIVAGIGIMVGIYNTMNDRKRDIAVMRALGAGRMTVMSVILAESTILAFCGGLAGFLLGHGGIGIVSSLMSGTTGVEIPFWYLTWQELVLLPGLMVLAALAGFWPAMSAYRTDVSRSLTATP